MEQGLRSSHAEAFPSPVLGWQHAQEDWLGSCFQVQFNSNEIEPSWTESRYG